MRLEPNIKSFGQVAAYIQAQESDYVASKGAQDKTKVNHVKPQEGDAPKEPKKDILCRICSKKHPKFKCTYTCKICGRKGHKSEACWSKFPEKAPGYNPALKKDPKDIRKRMKRRSKSTGSDRGSDFEASGSEAETPNSRGRRTIRRSNCVKVITESNPMVGTGLSHSESTPLWGDSRSDKLPPLRLFRIKAVERVLVEKKEAQDGVFYDGIYDLFNGLEYSWHYEGIEDLFNGLEYSKPSHFQRKVQKVLNVYG